MNYFHHQSSFTRFYFYMFLILICANVQALITHTQYMKTIISRRTSRSQLQMLIDGNIKNSNSNNKRKERMISESTLQVIRQSIDEVAVSNDNDDNNERWIILVDDEKDIRDAVGQYLSMQGYQITACADAESAFDVINSAYERAKYDETRPMPNLIITDIVMPGGKNGLDFLKQIRSTPILASIPVILLTAKGNTEDRVLGYKYGADAYLPKPFDPEELVSIIQSVILNYDELNIPLSNINVSFDDIQNDLKKIKQLLLQEGYGVTGGINRDTGKWNIGNKVFLIPDERKVLELLCEGLTNKEIANELYISQRRVEQHITSMFRKTEVGNRTELVRWAVSTGNVKI